MTTAELANSTLPIRTEPRLIAGRYRAHTRIGRGRLGEIFAATDEGCEELGVEQRLAIQVIPEDVVRNNRLFNQLNLGYTILRAAAHPNIVGIRKFGRDGKSGYLVMEHLDGASLRIVLDDAEMLDLDQAKAVIRGVGEALQLLHAKDMVHGNLAAKNVFITEELEVRLLDVLPLDGAQAIIRGAVTSAPFSRCTVEDDVLGLACLAYEMLAGKHPFNYSPPDEARLAGLEADRITSLTDREWNALRLALSFDRDQRTPSIADFMRDFGISETERLRPTADQPVRHETIQYPAVKEVPPMTRPAVPAHSIAIAAPVAAVNPVVLKADKPPNARPMNKKARPRRAVLLGMLLAGLSAWSYYGQPQDQVASLISYIHDKVIVGLTERRDGAAEISAPDPVQSVSTDRVAPVDRSAATAAAATVEATVADPELKGSVPERTATVEEPVAALAQPTDEAVPAASPQGEITTDTSDGSANRIANEASADTDAEPMQTEPQVVFFAPFVSVSERDGAARIAAPPTGYSATPLIWWTSAHTAVANEDFISVEQQIMADATSEDGNMLHIPLVDDNLPEPPESFFVSLGFRDSQHGHIERIATIRVDIIDDD